MMKSLFAVACLMLLTSCEIQQSVQLYSWHNSESAAYNYTKRGTEETLAEAMAQYEKVVKHQTEYRRVAPPGANAEYGYLLYKAGRKEEGLTLLNAEIKAYPESEKFISRIIKQLEK